MKAAAPKHRNSTIGRALKKIAAKLPATRRQRAKEGIRRILEADPPAKRKSNRRNPDAAATAAAAITEAFHGRPAREVREYEQTHAYRDTMADLGRLIELVVLNDEDEEIVIGPFKGVRLATSATQDATGRPTGTGQTIYFVGGDQAVNLEAFGIAGDRLKDDVTLGDALTIAYHTSKAFHDFEPSDYEHQFGEETGELPSLNYDRLNKRLYLSGGAYIVRPEGIVN